MKILHTVEFYHPSVGGMQEVVKQLSERLVRLGHEVTVATTTLAERTTNLLNGVKIEEFAIAGNLVRGMTGEVERYREFLLGAGFDVITNFAAQQWATDVMITMLDRVPARKVFVPTGFSGLHSPSYRDYFAAMPDWMRQYDANVVLSENYRDINFARQHGISNLTLIPNGAAADEFLSQPSADIRSQLGIPTDDLLILQVGSHTGIKGHAEAIRIFSRASLPPATFLLVGNPFAGGCARSCQWQSRFFNLSPARCWDRKKIRLVELSREQTVAAFQAADLFLFPSNIECSPVVLYECMASKTPFLSSAAGNAAEIVQWTGGGDILPTRFDENGQAWAEIDCSAKLLEQLVADPQRRAQMGESGYRAWRDRFTWEMIAAQYDQLYRQVISAKAQA